MFPTYLQWTLVAVCDVIKRCMQVYLKKQDFITSSLIVSLYIMGWPWAAWNYGIGLRNMALALIVLGLEWPGWPC